MATALLEQGRVNAAELSDLADSVNGFIKLGGTADDKGRLKKAEQKMGIHSPKINEGSVGG